MMRPRSAGRSDVACARVARGRPGREVRWAILMIALLAAVPAGAAPPTFAAGATVRSGPARQSIGVAHACIAPDSGNPNVDWSALHNPIVSYPTAAAKDEALLWTGGRWHMLFSYVTNDPSAPGGVSWNIATATSTDLAHWSGAVPWPRQRGVLGVASPDITRSPSGRFVVTYQSDPGNTSGGQDKLYYRTSVDLMHWSSSQPLAPTLTPGRGDRMIDAALAWTGQGIILGYKSGTTNGQQAFEIGWSPSGSLAGPWVTVGTPDITVYNDTVENYEFVTAGGEWRLIATSNQLDQPWIFDLADNPAKPDGWLHWTGGRELSIPAQGWDSGPGISSVGFEHANSAYLCDARATDGYYYLVYAGSSELTQFGGWGHAMIGIARSTDLLHWQVPGQAS